MTDPEQKMRPFRCRLLFKLIAGVGLVLALLLAAFSVLNIRNRGEDSIQTMYQIAACFDQSSDRTTPSKESRIFRNSGSDSHQLSSHIRAIYSEESCYISSHHADRPVEQLLGVVDLRLSWARLEKGIKGAAHRTIGFAGLIFVIVSGILALFSYGMANRKLAGLLEAVKNLTQGDYDRPISPGKEDEIGTLARAIDQMRLSIKEKTEALEENRRLFQTMFEQVPCYISVQNRDFKLLEVNKMFEQDFGRRIGSFCYAAYKGRDSVCPDCPVAKTFEDGQVHSSEETVTSRDGSKIYFLVLATPIVDRQGNITAVMEMSTDVTAIRRLGEELKRSEEKYRLLFNNDPNPTFFLDRQTLEILDANHRALADHGHTREKLIGRSFLELIDVTDQERVSQSLDKGETFLPQIQQIDARGSKFFVDIRASYDQHLDRRAIILSVVDITERLRAQQQLIQASKMATLGEMAAGVAHELNQPLSAIGTGAHFLLKGLNKGQPPEPGIMQEVIAEIVAQVERSSKIISHLREFGRKADVVTTKVNLNRPIRGVFSLLGQQLRVRNISVETDLDQELPPIWADANRLEQVFINLVINARDAIEQFRLRGEGDRQGLIKIRTFIEEGQVIATVSDNGIGINAEEKDRIFEPFFTTKEVGQGTGLGLSITYGIVTDYQGRIQVESEPGQGTTFRLSFPSVEEHDS